MSNFHTKLPLIQLTNYCENLFIEYNEIYKKINILIN